MTSMLPDKEGSKAQVGSCVRVMVAPIDNTRGEEPKRYSRELLQEIIYCKKCAEMAAWSWWGIAKL